MNKELEKYLLKYEQKMHEDLQDFVAIPSVSDDPVNVKKALGFIINLAKSYGFAARTVLDDQVGVIEMGEGPETMGILAHVDVVPPGDPREWTFDPYSAIDVEGRMYGRGTIDDKGMVISSLYAMRAVKSLGLPLKKKVQLILGTQEEVEWVDMDAYVKNFPLPDYGFTPDGEYPISNIEKGDLSQEMEFDFSDEAEDEGGRHLKALDIGTANNVVPGKAVAILSDGEEITVYGKACHSSNPWDGDNALIGLSKKLKGLGLKENKLLRLLFDIEEYFEDCYGSKLGLYSKSEYYQGEFVHRNTFAPTILKADKGKATLWVNARPPYGEDMDKVVKTLDDWARERGGKTVSMDAQPGVFVSKESPFLKVLADSYEDVTDFTNEFVLAYGGSYAKAMPNIVSWGPLFPGEEDTCHITDEYIDLESMMMSTKIFAEAIMRIVLSDESFK